MAVTLKLSGLIALDLMGNITVGEERRLCPVLRLFYTMVFFNMVSLLLHIIRVLMSIWFKPVCILHTKCSV